MKGETASKKKRLGKDLTVDTSFLPDDGKDDRDMELRNQLRVEWLNQQTKLKNQEPFNLVFQFLRIEKVLSDSFKLNVRPSTLNTFIGMVPHISVN